MSSFNLQASNRLLAGVMFPGQFLFHILGFKSIVHQLKQLTSPLFETSTSTALPHRNIEKQF